MRMLRTCLQLSLTLITDGALQVRTGGSSRLGVWYQSIHRHNYAMVQSLHIDVGRIGSCQLTYFELPCPRLSQWYTCCSPYLDDYIPFEDCPSYVPQPDDPRPLGNERMTCS